MAFKKKSSKKVEDTHNFGVPSADDEGMNATSKETPDFRVKSEKSKDDIKNHSKFDKFKKGMN